MIRPMTKRILRKERYVNENDDVCIPLIWVSFGRRRCFVVDGSCGDTDDSRIVSVAACVVPWHFFFLGLISIIVCMVSYHFFDFIELMGSYDESFIAGKEKRS